MDNIILETKELKTYFTKKKFLSKEELTVKAVDGVSLQIKEGETLGLVGESGCGKSTLGKTILNLVPSTEGEVYFRDRKINGLSEKEMFDYRRKMQLVFQNPYSALNPRMTVREAVEAPLKVFGYDKESRKERVEKIVQEVGLNTELLDRFPHEFSGGQRQRIVIARALVLEPEFVVCDEPVSALDVSVRAQILNLMNELQEKKKLTYLFVSHDLSVIKYISDRIAVMYLGSLVELADKDEFFSRPAHPYTKALLSAIPIPDVDAKRDRIRLMGEIPNVYDMPAGCKFHTRCPYATERCKQEAPEWKEISNNHFCACHML